MSKTLISSLLLALATTTLVQGSEPYKPDWTSLRRHNTPEWMENMKFGIYSHWGAQTAVTASGNMKMPYHEAIPLWTGENFDAKAWVDLFEAAGAQFAGPVAWHVTGMLNWDSKLTDWTSVNKGPKVDIYGELAREIRKRDMKLIASFHSSTLWGPLSSSDSRYLASDSTNDDIRYDEHGYMTSAYLEGWLERMQEGYELHKPDMVWVDVGFGGTVRGVLRGYTKQGKLLDGQSNEVPGIREDIQQRYIAGYFNAALEWGKEVEFIYKSFDVPPGVGMRDIEDGNLDGLQWDPWMADIDMMMHHHYPHPWFYNPNNPVKDANMLVDMLVDITSKNGRILLNVPPLVDGTFHERITSELYKIGDWLKMNGEAIYGTSPWVLYGEGPTSITSPGHHGQGKNKGVNIAKFTKDDIRFTQKGDTLYATCLGWPGEELHIRALGFHGKLYPNQIKSIQLLGSKMKLKWTQTAEELVVKFPAQKPCDFAYVLKIERR